MSDVTNKYEETKVGDLTVSGDVPEMFAAFGRGQQKLGPAIKDSVNPAFKKSYADLNAVMEVVSEAFSGEGFSICQPVSVKDGMVHVSTFLIFSKGDKVGYMSSTLSLVPENGTPQKVGSAITYGRRYGLGAMCGVVAEEDDDGNAASGRDERPVRREPPKPTSRASPPDAKKDELRTGSEKLVNDLRAAKSVEQAAKVWLDAKDIIEKMSAVTYKFFVDSYVKKFEAEPPQVRTIN